MSKAIKIIITGNSETLATYLLEETAAKIFAIVQATSVNGTHINSPINKDIETLILRGQKIEQFKYFLQYDSILIKTLKQEEEFRIPRPDTIIIVPQITIEERKKYGAMPGVQISQF